MASQLHAPAPFSNGNQITAANLNAHVNGAILLPGAITEQDAASTLQQGDTMLVQQSNLLKEATVAQIKTAMGLSDYVARNGTTNTGMVASTQLTLGTTAPLQPLHAVSLGHLTANYLKNSGSQALAGSLSILSGTNSLVNLTTSGIALLTTNQIATLSADPVEPLQAATKQYVDNLLAPQELKCRGFFSSTTILNPPSNILDESKFLTCQGSRLTGSTTLTINFSSLDARYKSSTTPFFLAGQYIGTKAASGITAHLYKINAVNYTSGTFEITTPETTAFTGAVQLSCVYDNSLNTDVDTFNCKSVYVCYASNKHYVNYWNDTVTGLKTNITPTEFLNTVVTGQSNTYNYSQTNCRLMINLFERNNWQFDQNVPEGFGSFSTGCHIGYFNSATDGVDYIYQYRASFAIF